MNKQGKINILILDDRNDARKDAVDKIQSGLDASGFSEAHIFAPDKNDIKEIVRRLAVASKESNECKEFSDFDICFVDNDLTDIETDDFPYTADAIIGRARGFSNTPIYVTLNRVEYNFDLRNLVGDDQTKADLAIQSGDLANPSLWGGPTPTGVGERPRFQPWYWPALGGYPSRRRQQVALAKENLSASILKCMGLPEEVVSEIPSTAVSFLDPASQFQDAFAISFWEHFLRSRRTLEDSDRARLLGLPGDRESLPKTPELEGFAIERVARIVSAECDLWLRRDIIGPQRGLLDAPHIASRIGFAPGKEPPKELSDLAALLDSVELAAVMAEHEVHSGPWHARRLYWWPSIKALPAVREEREKREFRYRFAEDSSRFFSAEGEFYEFSPERSGGLETLFVEMASDQRLSYSPRSFLAR